MSNSIGSDDKTVVYTSSPAASAKLLCLDSLLDESLHDLDITLGIEPVSIGRSDDNDIIIKFNKLSRHHARISYANYQWIIEDLNSANGTYVNEQSTHNTTLGQGDIVVIGEIPFRFEITSMETPKEVDPLDEEFFDDIETSNEQDIDTIEELASQEDEDQSIIDSMTGYDEFDEPPKKRRKSNKPPRHSYGQPKSKKKYIIAAAIIAISSGGYYLFELKKQQGQFENLYLQRSKDIQFFLESYESTTNSRTPDNTLDEEKNILNDLTKEIELAISTDQNHQGYKALKRQLLFLTFERNFFKKLRDDAIIDAKKLIEETQQALSKIHLHARVDEQNFDGLLDLADIAVSFKQFGEQYPDPKPSSTLIPDDAILKQMNELKARFIERKKANYLMLSVTYSRFHQLLEKIESEDIRLFNRWKEVIKQGT